MGGDRAMSELTTQRCEPCSGNAPAVSDAELAELKPQVPDWQIRDSGGERYLERVFKFPDFQTALNFTNRVGEAAEQQGHHPALLTEYGRTTVSWWTHAISDLHKNDFIMAAKTDEIARQFPLKN